MEEQWQAFTTRGLHLIYLNINSLVPEINELTDIAKRAKAAVIRLTKSKLDSTVLDPEIYKIAKFFVSMEISMGEVLLVVLEMTLALH